MLAQCVGIAAAERGWISARWTFWIGTLSLAVACGVRRGAPRRLLIGLLVACASARGLAIRLETAREGGELRPEEVTIEGRVLDSRHGAGIVEVELVGVRRVDAGPPPVPSRVLLRAWDVGGALPSSPLRELLSGERIRLRARLRAPRAFANPGGSDRERRLARRGIGAVGALVHPGLLVRIPEASRWNPLSDLEALRRKAAGRLAGLGPGGGLLRALALGDRAAISREARDAFRRLGVAHLLAVSGLHLALVMAVAFRAVCALLAANDRLLRRIDSRRVALGIAATVAVTYAWMAGWGIPVRRALVLALAMTLRLWTRRPGQPMDGLFLAAFLILSFEPQALFDPGAQLSFAVSAALLMGADRKRRAEEPEHRPRRGRALLRTSATATAIAGPIAAFQLGVFSPWGWVSNLVLIPWTALVLLPAALLATLLSLFSLDDVALAGWIAHGCEWAAAGTLTALLHVAPLVADAEFARPALPGLLGAAVLALVTLRLHRTSSRVLSGLGVSICLWLASPAMVAPAPPRAVFLDVGQGDSTLVQGRHAAVLVDAGTALPGGGDRGRSVVVPALRALGVERLDLVVVSHADLDHRGGVPSVLRAVPAAQVWLPRGARKDPAYAELRGVARARGVWVSERGAGDPSERFGDLTITPLWPPRGTGELSDNDRSLVLRIDLHGHRLLLPGDVERTAEGQLVAAPAALRADVLKLPHHGSRSSSSPCFLAGVQGAVAVASAPLQGRFGMPHPQVLARAHAAGYTTWWTGRDGAVLVGLGDLLWVRGWRGGRNR